MCGVALERGNYTKPEKKQLQLFENQKIRTAWDEEKEEWYFSIYGCGCGFDGTARPAQCQHYWAKLKQRLLSIRVRNELTAGGRFAV